MATAGTSRWRGAHGRLAYFFAGFALGAFSLVAYDFQLPRTLDPQVKLGQSKKPNATLTTLTLLQDEEVKLDSINTFKVTTQSQQFAHAKPLDHSNYAVFYNLYVTPNNTVAARRAGNVVHEQFAALGNSSLTRNGPVSVYVNTIGQSIRVAKACGRNKLECAVMRAYEPGKFEDVTLTEMHSFCQHYPTYTVIYLHSKGTFHPVETPYLSQSAWRTHMTRAIVHDDCLQSPSNDPVCDACGLVALPFPTLHFPGNFFTARCEYIRKLLPPTEFRIAIQSINAQGFLKRLSNQIVATIVRDAPYNYAVGRWSNEHWMGSHPDLQACDVSSHPSISYWQKQELRNTNEFQYASFPRHNLTDAWDYAGGNVYKATQAEAQRKREWFFLAGNLMKWHGLYGSIPPDDSWVWRFFPDGAEWLSLVKKLGVDEAIDAMTLKWKQG